MRILTCEPNVEVIGQVMLAFAANMRAAEIQPVLEKHGFTDIKPDEWYPAPQWMKVLNDIIRQADSMTNFVAIGLKTAEFVRLPEGEDLSLGKVFEAWDKIYQLQHRGGDIGYVRTEKIGDKHYKASWKLIYPDDMAYGVGYGFAKKFLEGYQFTLQYDPNVTRYDLGGEETVLHITWE